MAKQYTFKQESLQDIITIFQNNSTIVYELEASIFDLLAYDRRLRVEKGLPIVPFLSGEARLTQSHIEGYAMERRDYWHQVQF